MHGEYSDDVEKLKASLLDIIETGVRVILFAGTCRALRLPPAPRSHALQASSRTSSRSFPSPLRWGCSTRASRGSPPTRGWICPRSFPPVRAPRARACLGPSPRPSRHHRRDVPSQSPLGPLQTSRAGAVQQAGEGHTPSAWRATTTTNLGLSRACPMPRCPRATTLPSPLTPC